MNAFRLAALSLGVLQLSLTAAAAAPITLYDGSSLPGTQGWAQSYSGNATATVGAGTTEFNSTNGADNINLYKYNSGATDYIVSIRLQVFSSSYNHFDAGLVFSPFGTMDFWAEDRVNGLFIGESAVLWGDLGASHAVNTGVFHEYAMRYQNGNLDVFVDADFDAIAAGTATAVLSRASVGPSVANLSRGIIVWGDATNDVNVNSRYAVDFVKFQDLTPATPVPEPGTMTLLGLGLAGIVARRRRGASKVN
jgi:hypothetical protein